MEYIILVRIFGILFDGGGIFQEQGRNTCRWSGAIFRDRTGVFSFFISWIFFSARRRKAGHKIVCSFFVVHKKVLHVCDLSESRAKHMDLPRSVLWSETRIFSSGRIWAVLSLEAPGGTWIGDTIFVVQNFWTPHVRFRKQEQNAWMLLEVLLKSCRWKSQDYLYIILKYLNLIYIWIYTYQIISKVSLLSTSPF